MNERDLKPEERTAIEAMRMHAAHGFGVLIVTTTPEMVDIQEGKKTRFHKKTKG